MKGFVKLHMLDKTMPAELFALPEGNAVALIVNLDIEGQALFPDKTTGLYYESREVDQCPRCGRDEITGYGHAVTTVHVDRSGKASLLTDINEDLTARVGEWEYCCLWCNHTWKA